MRFRSLFWCVVIGLAAALTAAAPQIAFCDVVKRIDLGGRTPVGNIEGMYQGVAAVPAHWWDSGGRSVLGMAFISQVGESYQVSAGILDNGTYQGLGLEESGASISCPNPTQVATSISQVPANPNQSQMTVAALCGDNVEVAQSGPFADGASPQSWNRRVIDPVLKQGGLTPSIDIRYDKEKTAPGVMLLVTNGSESVYGYDLNYGDLSPVSPREYTFPSGQRGNWVKADFEFGLAGDGKSTVHMVLTRKDGGMNYHEFHNGSTQADPASFKDLGAASPDQAWNWPQVGSSENGWVRASAYNQAEGAVYSYRREPGTNHWLINAATTSTGPMGMYNSMEVNPETGDSFQAFIDSENNVRLWEVGYDGQMNMNVFDPFGTDDGQVYSTAVLGFGSVEAYIADVITFGHLSASHHPRTPEMIYYKR